VLARQRHTTVDRPDTPGQPHHADGAQDDTLHHVAGRGGGPGALRIRARPERRHPCAEGSCMHHTDAGRGGMRAVRREEGGHQGHRHTPRREDVRDAAHQRGVRQGRGHGKLLPRAGRQPRTQLRQVLQGGRDGAQRAD